MGDIKISALLASFETKSSEVVKPNSNINNQLSDKVLKNKQQIFDTVNINQGNTKTGSIQGNAFHNFISHKTAYIHVNTTYGNEQEITVKGRVTEDKEDATNSVTTDSKIKNLLRNLNILGQEELEKVSVDINFNGKTFKVQADEEGYFNAKLKDFGTVKPGYNKVQVSISQGQKYSSSVSQGSVTIQPKNDTSFGIVSDIDDTIQKSNVTHKWQALKTLLLKNYKTQEEVPGTSELYQALDKRNDGVVDGDVYYISGSPNQISTRVENFLAYNQFPEGSIDLKNMGLGKNDDSPTKQIEYKLGKIRNLFDTYPDKKFILFGDSGEKDPEIYKQIAKEYPNRVIATFINNVTNDNKNSSRYEGMLLTNNASESAKELLQKGLITIEDFENIKKQIK